MKWRTCDDPRLPSWKLVLGRPELSGLGVSLQAPSLPKAGAQDDPWGHAVCRFQKRMARARRVPVIVSTWTVWQCVKHSLWPQWICAVSRETARAQPEILETAAMRGILPGLSHILTGDIWSHLGTKSISHIIGSAEWKEGGAVCSPAN